MAGVEPAEPAVHAHEKERGVEMSAANLISRTQHTLQQTQNNRTPFMSLSP